VSIVAHGDMSAVRTVRVGMAFVLRTSSRHDCLLD
jgi:hypothetical protein